MYELLYCLLNYSIEELRAVDYMYSTIMEYQCKYIQFIVQEACAPGPRHEQLCTAVN